jgi:hypothetical protein
MQSAPPSSLIQTRDRDIPCGLRGSRLYTNGGYLFASGLIGPETLDGLRAEADSARPGGARGEVAQSDGTEYRGGSPARAYRTAPGGRLHWALHGSPQMCEAIAGWCGVTVEATGAGTFSYYEQADDFLALHRDVDSCDVTLITCLKVRDGASGGLLVYPNHMDNPISEIRAAGRSAGVAVPIVPGDTVALLGGIVAHEVTPASASQERIVSITEGWVAVIGTVGDGATSSDPSGHSSRSATSRATSSDRRAARAKPRSSRARSRFPARPRCPPATTASTLSEVAAAFLVSASSA